MMPNTAPSKTNPRRQARSISMMGVPFYINSKRIDTKPEPGTAA
jgi:hypothetical protein